MAAGTSTRRFEELVARGERDVLRLCRSVLRDDHLGADAAQETFLRLWRHLNRADASELERPDAWLRRAALSAALDLARRRALRADGAIAPLDSAAAPGDDGPADEAELSELRARLDAAVAELPEGQRTVFGLRHDGGLSLREVAELLGVALPTVKTQFARACLRLQARLSAFRDPHPGSPDR